MTIENPAVVFALILVAGIVPAKADPKFDPSILTLFAVGVFPAPAELSALGAPPAFQFQPTYSGETPPEEKFIPCPTVVNPSASKDWRILLSVVSPVLAADCRYFVTPLTLSSKIRIFCP